MVKNLHLFFIGICLLFASSSFAQCGALSENFFNATPANPPSGWDVNGVEFKSAGAPYYLGTTDSFRAGLNAIGEFVRTKTVTCPDSISFMWRSSGASNNFGVAIEYSLDNITWIALDSVITANTTYTKKSINFNQLSLLPPFQIYVRWNMYRRVSGTFYVDDVCLKQGVCHAIASEVRFNQYTNNCVPSGIPFSISACATDANGNVDTTYNGSVMLSLGSGAGALGGTLTTNAVAGCAQFNNVTYNNISPLSINALAGAFSSNSPLIGLDIKTVCPNVDTLIIATYNLLNFPEGGVYALGGACSPVELGPKRWDTLKTIMQYMKPDIMIVQELQTQAGADSVLAKSLNVNGITKYARAPYIENRSTANKKYNNELFYNTDKLVLVQTNTLGTSIRDCGQYILYCKDPMLNVHNDTTYIDMYSIHTKAKGLGAAQASLDSIQRTNDCTLVMDSLRYRQSTERNAIIGGDMNLYTSTEGAYQAFITGLYKFNDPVNQPGAWESNPAFAALHTQAARSSSRASLECGAKGGLDSRLDFLLSSDPIMTGSKNMQYIPNTYYAFGNSGNLFNKSVDTSTNTSGIPANVTRSLANMSDHIPVVMKVAVTYPSLTPLSVNEMVILSGVMNSANANLTWDIVLAKNITSLELLCDDIVIFKHSNLITNKYTHQGIKNGLHTYKVRIKTIDGKIIMSNTIKLFQNKNTNYDVYPNPFTDKIVISNIGKSILPSIIITDSRGVIVMKKEKIAVVLNSVECNTENLPNGIYFVMVEDGENKKVYKIVK
jgi:hypothetical protein